MNDQHHKLAASYARSAAHNPAGIQQQHEQNASCAAQDGYTILPEHYFGDDGVSGLAMSRPALDRLLSLVTQGEAPIERIYMRDPSRLARLPDPRQPFYCSVTALMDDHGVQICYSAVGSLADPMVAELLRVLKDRMDSAITTSERVRRAQEVKRGQEWCALSGYYPGSAAPYGTERWLVDMHTNTYVEQIPESGRRRRPGCAIKLRWCEGEPIRVLQNLFRWVGAEGLSPGECAQCLHDQQVAPPGRAACWSAPIVRRLLVDPIVCGDLVWGRSTRDGTPYVAGEGSKPNDAPLRIPNYLPGAPISRVEFDGVQEVLQRRRGARSR